MILKSSPASPFGRKVKIAASHLGLMDRIKVDVADTINPDDPIRKINPLGKIPALVLDDGRCVFDSRVILECLDHMAGGGKILPQAWDVRLAALTQQALADGIADAGLLIVYEDRYRPAEVRHKPWLEHQLGKVERGLEAVAAAPPDASQVNVGTIATACALGYLDLRKQTDWRARHPSLVAWLDTFRKAAPSYDATMAPT